MQTTQRIAHVEVAVVLPDGDIVMIDEKLAPYIKELNDFGIRTSFCCQGGDDRTNGYIAFPYKNMHLVVRREVEQIMRMDVRHYLEYHGEGHVLPDTRPYPHWEHWVNNGRLPWSLRFRTLAEY